MEQDGRRIVLSRNRVKGPCQGLALNLSYFLPQSLVEDVIKSLGEIGAMNAERLHLILKLASEAFGSSKISKSLRLLRDALQNQVNEPSNANHQQQVSSNLADLRNKLSALATNDFPPPWKQTLREVKLANLIGSELKNHIDEIFPAIPSLHRSR